MKEKTIVSATALVISLAGYFYAKSRKKDTVPYVMIGGFMGAMFGEVIVSSFRRNMEGADRLKGKPSSS